MCSQTVALTRFIFIYLTPDFALTKDTPHCILTILCTHKKRPHIVYSRVNSFTDSINALEKITSLDPCVLLMSRLLYLSVACCPVEDKESDKVIAVFIVSILVIYVISHVLDFFYVIQRAYFQNFYITNKIDKVTDKHDTFYFSERSFVKFHFHFLGGYLSPNSLAN